MRSTGKHLKICDVLAKQWSSRLFSGKIIGMFIRLNRISNHNLQKGELLMVTIIEISQTVGMFDTSNLPLLNNYSDVSEKSRERIVRIATKPVTYRMPPHKASSVKNRTRSALSTAQTRLQNLFFAEILDSFRRDRTERIRHAPSLESKQIRIGLHRPDTIQAG